MTYAWIITQDHLFKKYQGQTISFGKTEAGTMGPRGTKFHRKQILKHPKKEVFKMYDDDGVLYYTGQIAGDDFDGFEPLDDFGMPNAGCTAIKYKNPKTGAWEEL